MGKTQYQKCTEVLKENKEEEITFEDLILLIKIKIGSNKYLTIKPCFELMIETKLIKEVEHGRFRILCR
jgi:hypothetical protein